MSQADGAPLYICVYIYVYYIYISYTLDIPHYFSEYKVWNNFPYFTNVRLSSLCRFKFRDNFLKN